VYTIPSWFVVGLGFFIAIHLTLSLIYFENWFYLRKARLKYHLFLKGLVSKEPDDKEASNKASIWLGARVAEIKRRVLKLGLNGGIPQNTQTIV